MNITELEKFRKNIRILEILLEDHEKENAAEDGLTIPQFHVLAAISEKTGCSLNDVAADLVLDKSTISRTIDGLVKLGLVIRETNPDNRRLSTLNLTESGQNSLSKINSKNNSLYTDILEEFPNEIRIPFLEGFDLFALSLKKRFIK